MNVFTSISIYIYIHTYTVLILEVAYFIICEIASKSCGITIYRPT